MKRFFTSILLSLFLFPLFSISAKAEDLQTHLNSMGSDVQENLTKYSGESAEGFAVGWGVALVGGKTESGESINDDNALNFATSNIARLVTDPPVETGEYVADVMHNLGIAQPAYAQGIGYSALTPTLRIWKAFRNISYFLFIIIFIVVGFMIMFRAQINPQTVVTIQAALPKMVLSLILITFSYAIAGFVIDMIYLILFVVTGLFASFGILSDAGLTRDVLFGRSIFSIGLNFLTGSSEVAGDASRAIGSIIETTIDFPFIEDISSVIAFLIIAVALIIAVFRTLLSLVMSWINIILSVIFAPIQLLLNAFPQVDTFGGWLKNLVANAMVFPAVGIMVIIGTALVGGNAGDELGVAYSPESSTNGTGWVPPLVSNKNPDATDPFSVQAIIGMGMILILPEVSKIVKGALGAEDKLGLGQIVGANLKAGVAPVSNVAGAPFRAVGSIAGAGVGYAKQYAGVAMWEGVANTVGGSGPKRKKEAEEGVGLGEERDDGQATRRVPAPKQEAG